MKAGLSHEAEAFLKRLQRARTVPLSARSVTEARAYVAAQAKLALKKYPSRLKVTDIMLSHQLHALSGLQLKTPLRFYRPPRVAGASLAPLILYFHGGGFFMGNADYGDGLCQELALATGALVVAVDYHLAPEWPFPTAVYEGFSVLETLYQHHEAYRFDPSRITLLGDSAGGNLAAVIAGLAKDTVPLFRTVLAYPVLDFKNDYPSHQAFGTGYFLTKEDMDFARGLYLQDLKNAEDSRASPMLEVPEGLPPTLILTAEFDPLHDEGVQYAKKLAASDNLVEHHNMPGEIHCFLTFVHLFPQAAKAGIGVIQRFLA